VGAEIVSVKGHLHGPVATVSKLLDPSGDVGVPYLAGNDTNPEWLVTQWVRLGFLRRNPEARGTKYSVGSLPKLSLGTRADAEARQIGRCLGVATSKTSLKADSDLVLLSSCAEPDNIVPALAGEIAIVRERCPELLAKVRKAVKEQRHVHARLALRSELDVFVALNSGARKYLWFTSDSFQETVEKVTCELNQQGNGAMADQWLLLWPNNHRVGDQGDDFLSTTIRQCGGWILILNTTLLLIDYWIILMGRKTEAFTDSDVDVSKGELRQWIKRTRSIMEQSAPNEFLELVKDVDLKMDELDERLAFAWCERGNGFIFEFIRKHAQVCLDNATVIANSFGAIDVAQNFTYAVFFEVNSSSSDATLALERCIRSAIKRQQIETYYYLPENKNPWRTGRWVLLAGNRNSDQAARLCYDLAGQLLNVGQSFRGAVLGQLAVEDCLRSFHYSAAYASGYFFRRLSQLRPHVLSSAFDNRIGFANETRSPAREGDKFVALSPGDAMAPKVKIVVSDDSELPFKEFEVSHIVMSPSRTIQARKASKEQALIGNPENADSVVLVCTATDKEDDAILAYLQAAKIGNKLHSGAKGVYRVLDRLGSVQAFSVRSSMGSEGSGGAFATTLDAIDDLNPDYVISCGLAFGRSEERQRLGDVLVSEWVRGYDKGRQGPGSFTPRSDRVSADPRLLATARLLRPDLHQLRITTGGFLSGGKLVDDPDFKARIWAIEPEAVGGDMEGVGIVDACARRRRRWIVVKTVCDWGENKESDAQPQAASNAVKLVFEMILRGSLNTTAI
jgi:nucleoside phosphorylase